MLFTQWLHTKQFVTRQFSLYLLNIVDLENFMNPCREWVLILSIAFCGKYLLLIKFKIKNLRHFCVCFRWVNGTCTEGWKIGKWVEKMSRWLGNDVIFLSSWECKRGSVWTLNVVKYVGNVLLIY